MSERALKLKASNIWLLWNELVYWCYADVWPIIASPGCESLTIGHYPDFSSGISYLRLFFLSKNYEKIDAFSAISNGTRMFWKALGWASFVWFQTSWSIGLMHMIEPLQCPLWFKLLTIGHQASFGSTTICFEVFSLEKKHYCGTGLFIFRIT